MAASTDAKTICDMRAGRVADCATDNRTDRPADKGACACAKKTVLETLLSARSHRGKKKSASNAQKSQSLFHCYL